MVHSEGKDEERIVAILRLQGGSPHLCQLRITSFWLWWQVLICTDRMSGFMGPDKPSSFCNYYVEPHLPASCGAFTFGGRMRPRAKTSSLGAGARFRHSRDLRMVVIRESLRESSVWRVGQVLSPAGCISIWVTATLSVMSDSLSLQSSHSMFGVLLIDSRIWIWIWLWLYYHYDYCI